MFFGGILRPKRTEQSDLTVSRDRLAYSESPAAVVTVQHYWVDTTGQHGFAGHQQRRGPKIHGVKPEHRQAGRHSGKEHCP